MILSIAGNQIIYSILYRGCKAVSPSLLLTPHVVGNCMHARPAG
jgi:hypothetical protein